MIVLVKWRDMKSSAIVIIGSRRLGRLPHVLHVAQYQGSHSQQPRAANLGSPPRRSDTEAAQSCTITQVTLCLMRAHTHRHATPLTPAPAGSASVSASASASSTAARANAPRMAWCSRRAWARASAASGGDEDDAPDVAANDDDADADVAVDAVDVLTR